MALSLGLFTGNGWSLDLVREGQATSAIILPDQSVNEQVIDYAAQELQYHIRKATGAELEIIKENDLQKTERAYPGYIYLGECQAAREAGIDAAELPPNAFILKTLGPDFFLVGKDGGTDPPLNDHVDMGTLFAVYEFLDRQMGVCWLWPGELGEVIPPRRDLASGHWDQTELPQFLQRWWREPGFWGGNGWSSERTWWNYHIASYVWLRRQRFIRNYSLSYGEAFLDYWARFGKTHPEFFNLLPNGKREPDPHYPAHVSMCVSEPKLWQQMVEDWKNSRTDTLPWLNCTPNDTPAKCLCERCLAWDVHAPEEAVSVEKAKQAFLAGADDGWNWIEPLGSLSDRFARFYLAVQQEAQKVDPDVTVISYAYANYIRPPLQTRLNDHVVISLASYFSFPYPAEVSQEFRQDWGGWAATGARLILRPNITYGAHNLPVNYARRLGEDLAFAFQHGLIATDCDSLLGHWASQGPTCYVIARVQVRPDLPVQQILEEYYQAFGPAEAAVRAYWEHWERVTDAVSREAWARYMTEYKRRDPGGFNFRTFYKAADLIFTPAVMAQGRDLLKKAEEQAQGDPLAQQRVAFLEKGLRHAELVLEAQRGFAEYRQTGELETFVATLRQLDDYRASIEEQMVADMSVLAFDENLTWDRDFMRIMAIPGKRRLENWKFQWDPHQEGEAQGWHETSFDDSSWFDIATDKAWEEQEVGRQWRQEHGEDYNGRAWYRSAFTVDPPAQGKHFRLLFGAVDEACTLWVNGKLLLERPYPYQGDVNSWNKPFELDVTKALQFDAPNQLAVRVEDHVGAGGIWKPVWLVEAEE